MATKIKLDDLPPEARKKLGVKKPRESRFKAEEMRSWAIKVLAEVASLSRSERERVLKHALKVNRL